MKDIHARVPVNKTAALVVAKGTHFEGSQSETTQDSDLPLPIRRPSRCELLNPRFTDLTGTKVGEFVVLGLSASFNKRWVVRCLCGKYSLRTTGAIRYPGNPKTMACDNCNQLYRFRRRQAFEITGVWPD